MTRDETHGDLSVLEAGERDSEAKSRSSLANVTVFGLPLCRRKTDAEYIASVRKVVSRSKWMIVGYGIAAILWFGMCVLIPCTVFDLVSAEFGGDGTGLGLIIGLVSGYFAGYFLIQGGSCLVHMLTAKQGLRTERLMLKFYDELQRRKGVAGATDSPGGVAK